VISQIYGGGGNSGATLKNDFIELYNRGASVVDVTGWSVQYASASGTTWQTTALSGTIPAGGYYLVKEAQGSGGTVDLPTPDATGTTAMSATAGKVALVRSTTALSGSCPSSTNIVDLVGYGTADCFEGAVAPALTNTTALIRTAGGIDTHNNSIDFATGAPNPHNGGLPTSPTATGLAIPGLIPPGGSVLFVVTVTPGTTPTSTGIAVLVDLAPIGGSATQQFYDDGTHGDAAAGDNAFSFQATVSSGISSGSKAIAVAVGDAQSRTATTTIRLTVGFDMIFAHIADGPQNKTHLLLTNASETATNATLTFWSNTGTPLILDIDGTNSSSFRVSVPAFGSAKIATSGLSPGTVTGWSTVNSNPPVDLTGNAIF
jgi:hypothetical protein